MCKSFVMRVVLVVAFAMLLSVGLIAQEAETKKETRTEKSMIESLTAALAAERDKQAQQQATIEMLTAQAEAANRASLLAKSRVQTQVQETEARLRAALKRTEDLRAEGEAAEADAARAEKFRADLSDELSLAQSQYYQALATAQLAQQQGQRAEAMRHYALATQEAQANAALHDYVLSGAAGVRSQAQSDYWIGIQCEPAVDVTVRLEDSPHFVPVKGGLVVNSVIDDTPAKQAGIKELDVILYANDKPMNQIEDLVAFVAENKDQPAKLSIVRDHEILTIEVTPTKREDSEESQPRTTEVLAGEIDTDAVQRWYGVWAADNTGPVPAIPDGFEAELRFKAGAEPQLHARRGENEWTVIAGDVKSLPVELHAFASAVFRVLLRPAEGQWWAGAYPPAQKGPYVFYSGVPGHPNWLNSGHPDGAMKAQLDALQTQLDELRRQVEHFKK